MGRLCRCVVPPHLGHRLRMFMEEIGVFLIVCRLIGVRSVSVLEEKLHHTIKKSSYSRAIVSAAHFRSVLFHRFRSELMKFFPIELGSTAVVFLLNIFCLTVVLVEECFLNDSRRQCISLLMTECPGTYCIGISTNLHCSEEERFRNDNGKARGNLPKLKPSPGCVQIRRTNEREMNAQATMSSWTIDAHEHSVGHRCPRRVLRFTIKARLNSTSLENRKTVHGTQTLLAGIVLNRLKIASMSDFVGSSIVGDKNLFSEMLSVAEKRLFNLDHLWVLLVETQRK